MELYSSQSTISNNDGSVIRSQNSMSQYTEEEIDQIIGKCENLITPDDATTSETPETSFKIVQIKTIKTPKSVILTNYLNETQVTNPDDYFESFFQECKKNKNAKLVRLSTNHFPSHFLNILTFLGIANCSCESAENLNRNRRQASSRRCYIH